MTVSNQRKIWLSCLCVISLVCVSDVLAQRPVRGQGRGGRPGTKRAEQPKREQAKKKAEEKKPEKVVAIVGADVHTVSGEVIRRGTVLLKGTKIWKVGENLEVPKDAKVIDATGKVVTPGFVAINMSRIALRSSSGKPEDSLDPFDRNIKLALGVGITSGCVSLSGSSSRGRGRRDPSERFLGLEPLEEGEEDPQWNPDFGDKDTALCPCCGLPILSTAPVTPFKPTTPTAQKTAVLKLSHGQLDGMLAKESPFYQLSPGSLRGALNKHNWRQSIAVARDYLKDLEKHEAAVKAGKKDSKAPKKMVTDELLKVVKKEIPVRIQARTQGEIKELVQLAKEQDFRLIVEGAGEGWLLADELSEASVPVIITPRRRIRPTPGNEDKSGSSVESSGIFERSGVPFAVASLSSSISMMGLAGRDLTSLPLEAAFAVRGGASEKTALASITLTPAKMLGMDDRIGSIEAGKDADILILSGSPLDYRTYVEQAIVNGHLCYDRAADRVYPVFER